MKSDLCNVLVKPSKWGKMLLCVLLTAPLAGQQATVDSLEAIMERSANDSMRLELQVQITEAYLSSDAEACLDYARQTIVEAYKLDELWLVPYLYSYMGMSYDDLGRYEDAVRSYTEAIEMTMELMANDSVYYDEYQRDLVVFMNNVGYSEFNRGNIARAIEHYIESLDRAIEYESEDISVTYGSIAELYFEIGDLENARHYVDLASKTAFDSATLVFDASLLGHIYIEQGKTDSAIQVFEALFNKPDGSSNNYDRAIASAGIAEAMLNAGRYEQVANWANISLENARELGNKVYEAIALSLLSRAQFTIGNHDEAVHLMGQAIRIAQTSGSLLALAEMYVYRSEQRAALGDFQGAFESERAGASLKDSISKLYNAAQFTDLMASQQAKRDAEEADDLRSELAEHIRREVASRRFALAMLFCAFVLALTTYYVIRKRQSAKLAQSPILVQDTGDDKLDFMRKMALTVIALLVPILIYKIFGQEYIDAVYTGVAIMVCALVYFAVKIFRYNPIVILIITAYPLLVVIPQDTSAINALVLWIPATFIILSYATDRLRLQVLNGTASFLAFIGYLYRVNIGSVDNAAFRVESQVIIGVMALMAVYVALYLHRGRMFDYRFGLNSTNNFLRLMADSNPNFVFAKDRDRNYTFVNKAMVDTYGRPLGDLIGKKSEEVNPAFVESPHFREDDLAVMEQGVEKLIPEEKIYAANGAEKWLQTFKRPIRDESGNVVGMIGVATDITEMRNSQEEQRRSLSLLEATIDSTADGLLVVDLNNDIVLYNQKFTEIWGEDVVGGEEQGALRMRKAAEKLKDPKQFVARVEEIFKDPTAKTYDTIEFIDGKIVERYSQAQMIGDQVVGRVWSFRDVTAREMALRSLKRSEERYRSSLEDNVFSIVRVKDGRLLSVNNAFVDLVGYSREELKTLVLSDILHSEDMATFAEFIQSIRSGQLASGNVSCRVLRKDGKVRYLLASVKGYYEEDGTYEESTVIAADVTQLQDVQVALAESEERYRSLVEASPDGIMLTDMQGRVTYASRRFAEMTGFAGANSPIGRSLLEFAVPEEFERASRDLSNALETHAPAFGRYWVTIESGERLRVELGTRVVRNAEGNPLGVIVVVRDITEKAKAELILKQSEARYRVLFENTFDGFLILGQDGMIEDVNQSAMELLRYPDAAAMTGLKISNIFPDIMDQESYREVVRGEMQKTLPIRLEGRDFYGSAVYAEVNLSMVPMGDGLRIACAIRDVAERVVLENKEREIKNQENQLDALNRELASHSIFNSQKLKLLTEIKEDIEEARKMKGDAAKTQLARVRRKIDANLNEQEDMMAFKIQFEKIHPNFFKRLTELSPKLTGHDLKYCAYIRLNMSTQDISNLLFVEKKSVEMSKYRIKKKLGLDRGERLSEFLMAI